MGDTKRRTNEEDEWIPVSVDNFPCRVPRDVETVGDLRDALELDAGREIVRVVEGDEEIYPGQSRLGVDRLGDEDEPVVIGEGDEFLTRETQPSDPPAVVPRESVEDVAGTFRVLAEENRTRYEETDGEEGDLGAASAYEDAANHVERELLYPNDEEAE